jgi:ribonuclease D
VSTQAHPAVEWVRTPDGVARLAERLRGCRALALDTEADSLHHYASKVCLVQVADDAGGACLVDPLVLDGLAPLGPVLADAGIVKVLHGADYDVTILKRDYGFEITGLFDTMIAARLLGLPEVGLQALARAELGVELEKAFQKDDWSRRPLSPAQEAYAIADVAHLLELRARLAARLVERGRLAWVEEECAAVAALPAARRGRDPEAWRRVKGAGRLAPRALAVLKALHGWRERMAEAADLPPFRILGNDTLLAFAQSPPRSAAEVAQARGVSPRVRREAAAVFEVLRAAQALPAGELPERQRSPRPVVSAAQLRRGAALKAWRAEASARLGLDVAVVLPQRLVDALAETAPADPDALAAVDGLRRWRVEAFGTELLAALRRA